MSHAVVKPLKETLVNLQQLKQKDWTSLTDWLSNQDQLSCGSFNNLIDIVLDKIPYLGWEITLENLILLLFYLFIYFLHFQLVDLFITVQTLWDFCLGYWKALKSSIETYFQTWCHSHSWSYTDLTLDSFHRDYFLEKKEFKWKLLIAMFSAHFSKHKHHSLNSTHLLCVCMVAEISDSDLKTLASKKLCSLPDIARGRWKCVS